MYPIPIAIPATHSHTLSHLNLSLPLCTQSTAVLQYDQEKTKPSASCSHTHQWQWTSHATQTHTQRQTPFYRWAAHDDLRTRVSAMFVLVIVAFGEAECFRATSCNLLARFLSCWIIDAIIQICMPTIQSSTETCGATQRNAYLYVEVAKAKWRLERAAEAHHQHTQEMQASTKLRPRKGTCVPVCIFAFICLFLCSWTFGRERQELVLKKKCR